MSFRSVISNKLFKIIFFTAIGFIILYVILRLTVFDRDPLLPLINSIYNSYLLLPEWIVNQVFKAQDAGVIIQDHQFVFEQEGAYQISYTRFIENWQKFLLHKRWSLLILFVIWVNFSPLRKKLLQTIIFLLTHVVAVVLGLLLMGVIGPKIINDFKWDYFSPTLIGNFILLVLFAVLLILNKGAIRDTILKLGFNIKLSDSKMYEIIVLLLFLIVLRDYLIPFIEYKPYVIFLLEISRGISSIFGYHGYISGDQLIGANGALALAKHCLGFMTIYLFAAMVFVTRPLGYTRITLFYILSGVFLIFISNIVRLVLVFIVAQGENGYSRASLHHEIYNIGIYIFIFILWVAWFEMVRKRSGKLQQDDTNEK